MPFTFDYLSNKDLFQVAQGDLDRAVHNINILQKYLLTVTVEEGSESDINREDIIINNIFYDRVVEYVTKYNVIMDEVQLRVVKLNEGSWFDRLKSRSMQLKLLKFEQKNTGNLKVTIDFMQDQSKN